MPGLVRPIVVSRTGTTKAGRKSKAKVGGECSTAMKAVQDARYGNPVSMAVDLAQQILGRCRAKAHVGAAKVKAQQHARAYARKSLSAKAERAKANYRQANKHEQRYAEAQESHLAGKIHGTQSSDNLPVDVTVPRAGGKGTHGIEVKTIVSGRNDKITMKKEAVAKKIAWEHAEKGRVIHTVVMDHRDKFAGGENKESHSGHELYYKRGVGAFRIGTMHKVKDHAELLALMEMPAGKLPSAARGPKR